MRNFQLITAGVDVVPLHHALVRQPELWNRHGFRREYANTPHADVDDIWLRYSDPERTADPDDTAAVQNTAVRSGIPRRARSRKRRSWCST